LVDDAIFNAFISDFKQFQGQMLEFKSTTERRLYDNGLKLITIESEMQKPKLCPSHESLLTMIATVKNGETRQSETNAKVEVKQQSQDKSISDVEKTQAVQTFQLTRSEKLQLNLTTLFTFLITLMEVIKIFLSR